MKKKCIAVVCGIVLMMGMTACSSDEEVKIVEKIPQKSTEQEKETKDSDITGDTEETTALAAKTEKLTGYVYQTEGTQGEVSLTTDIDMATVMESLGEPISYFESASCAFQGLDKIYTYDHYRVETYPDGENDMISSIIFTDDLVETAEGLSIGMTTDDMERLYGTDYEENAGMIIYTKDGKHLKFLIEADVIISIEYASSALD